MDATGGSIAASSCPSSRFSHKGKILHRRQWYYFIIALSASVAVNVTNHRRSTCCLAVLEPSTSAVAAENKEKKELTKEEGGTTPPAAKPKAAAKAAAKPLPELMEEDVIPSLKQTLEAQDDITEIELSFDENKLEGSFLNKCNPCSFWAFLPDGSINGPKGFSISPHGSEVRTVEPFLVDKKKPTAKHVVFWVKKRLAAQGIIPVWED